ALFFGSRRVILLNLDLTQSFEHVLLTIKRSSVVSTSKMNPYLFVCAFCQSSEEAEITGPLLKKDDVVAHHNCLLYSSNLVNKNTPDDDDLLGFDTEDVKEEMRRGRKLKCSQCKRRGATVGCEIRKCKRSFHYQCAMEANAKNVEDVRRGVFKIYCHSHRYHLEEGLNAKNSKGEHLKHTNNKDESDDDVKRKRPRLSIGFDAEKQERERSCEMRRILDDDDSAASDEGQNDIELQPLESDLNDSGDELQNSLNLAEHENGRHFTDEPQPSTSGAFQTMPGESRSEAQEAPVSDSELCEAQEAPELCENEPSLAKMGRVAVSVEATENQVQPDTGDGDETDIDSDQGSQSLVMPIKITKLELIALAHSESTSGSASPRPSGVAAHFWRKCLEAGCVESIFSTFMSVMTNISERILSEQASEEDCAFSLRVLEASGMLPEIFAEKDQEFQEKLLNLQRVSEAVMKSRSSMKSASEMMGKVAPGKTS
ncbi:hypothetical protein AAFF_G00211030, partial [Aldrovandia affinis]